MFVVNTYFAVQCVDFIFLRIDENHVPLLHDLSSMFRHKSSRNVVNDCDKELFSKQCSYEEINGRNAQESALSSFNISSIVESVFLNNTRSIILGFPTSKPHKEMASWNTTKRDIFV